MSFLYFKYRLYPTEVQQKLLDRNFGAKRWIFNHFLAENQRRYLAGEKYLNAFGCNYEITKLKKLEETSWLKYIDDRILKNASADLGNAYQRFWNSIKGKGKVKSKFPKFKNKYSKQSYRTMIRNQDLTSCYFTLPKIKNIKFKYHRPIQGTIKTCTVTKTPSGKYFVSILCEVEHKQLPKTGFEVGIDLGLKDLAILSNGIKFQHPEQILAKPKLKLKTAQKRMARKKKGSRRFKRDKLKVAKAYEKVTNVRNAYYHNISTYLVNTFDNIYMEDLNVKGMLQNRKLSRKIHETAWSTLKCMIAYKAAAYGKNLIEIDRFYASSKTCSDCGHKNVDLTLKDREWTCSECGVIHDRDWNASLNILQEGQRLVYGQKLTADDTAVVDEAVYSLLPTSLKKFAYKIERSDQVGLFAEGPEKTLAKLK